MADWTLKLDQFLQLSERGLLTHSGTISTEQAAAKADEQFDRYRSKRELERVSDFDLAAKAVETAARSRLRRGKARSG
jgi:hypothetical protein